MELIETIAAAANVSFADVINWIECLKVWTDKGYTVEQAIAKHGETLLSMANSASRMRTDRCTASDDAFRSVVADQVWEGIN